MSEIWPRAALLFLRRVGACLCAVWVGARAATSGLACYACSARAVWARALKLFIYNGFLLSFKCLIWCNGMTLGFKF